VWDHRATFRCSIGADDFVCKADENLQGYDACTEERVRLTHLLPLYRLVRWLGEIRWFTEHDLPDAAVALAYVSQWRPARE
jgi:hypothetical protein